MRIRLVHTQALLLLSAVLIAVLAMGALSAWNLRNGFSDYLASRDVERLEQFALLISDNAEQAGGIDEIERVVRVVIFVASTPNRTPCRLNRNTLSPSTTLVRTTLSSRPTRMPANVKWRM